MTRLLYILLAVFCFSCNKQVNAGRRRMAERYGRGKIAFYRKQFRGFDNAMVEIGYRYQELYWAGKDENWEYAGYQVEKINLALMNGLHVYCQFYSKIKYIDNELSIT